MLLYGIPLTRVFLEVAVGIRQLESGISVQATVLKEFTLTKAKFYLWISTNMRISWPPPPQITLSKFGT
jgi:hypothetical protein